MIKGYGLLRIVSGSMEPAYPVGTYIVVKRTPPKELQTGDVITFYSPDQALHGMPNTHRIKEIRITGGKYSFKTQGDANPAADWTEVPEEKLIGKVVGTAGFLKPLGRLWSNDMLFLLIILLPLAVIVVVEFRNLIRIWKHPDQGEK